jgi:hypothetical protein
MSIGQLFADWKKSGANEIQGWLHDESVQLTEVLLEAQKHLGLNGALIEIGVWKGKYFSALLALQKNRLLIGYDIWLNEDIETIKDGILKYSSNKNFALKRVNSADINAKEDREEISGMDIHFISIDGDHTFDGALRDMRLSRKLVSPGAVLALDDFLNPGCLGTTESAILFLQESDFEPICYITNKLFVTTKGWSEIYRQRIDIAISQNPTLLGIEILSGTAPYVTSIAGKKLYSFRN